ncbi:MAG: tetratricopeptide repeat protein [Gammaproteobacteria bacterium]|nr:tetratricopeptide repeat protein [Gammaproteobacteria bacterium]
MLARQCVATVRTYHAYVQTVALSVLVAMFSGCAGTTKIALDRREPPYDPLGVSNTVQSPQSVVNNSVSFAEIKQLMLKKQYPMAEAKLRLRIVKLPNDAMAWANLGLVLNETNRTNKAEQALRKAVSINAHFVAAYVHLAAVLKRQGKIRQSLDVNKKAIDIDPQYANAHYNLAILYDLYYDDVPKAYEHLSRYLENVSDDKIASAWLKQLGRMLEKQKNLERSDAVAEKLQ